MEIALALQVSRGFGQELCIGHWTFALSRQVLDTAVAMESVGSTGSTGSTSSG